MLSRKNFHCRLLKFEVASWPCTFDALYVSIKRCFDYMHYCTAVKSVLDIICLHRWLAAKRHVVFWLSVCQVSVIMYQKFVNTIPYKLLVGIWIYNLDAAGNKDNWLGFEVKRSKVKVTVRPSVWHSVMLSGQIWSEKHLGSFEGHVLKCQYQWQPVWWRHTGWWLPSNTSLSLCQYAYPRVTLL